MKFMTQSWLLTLYLDCNATGARFPTTPKAAAAASQQPAAAPPAPASHNCSAIAANDRNDCGFPGMKPPACTSKGCCWDAHKATHAIPACFYNGPAPPPPKCSEIPVSSRGDCGHPNMTAASCTSKGCCWSETGTPWCFLDKLLPPSPPPPAPLPRALQCPSLEAVAEMKAALASGHVTYHAFPFNAEPELLSGELFEFGLGLGASISKAVGLPAPTVMSQRDVPSMSRAVIPLLAKAGTVLPPLPSSVFNVEGSALAGACNV